MGIFDSSDDKKDTRSTLGTRAIRSYLNLYGLPYSARHFIASNITGSGKFSGEDLDDDVKIETYRAIKAANIRTGKTEGGTEYADYGKDLHSKLQRLRTTPEDLVVNMYRDPRYTAATTLGRFSYKLSDDGKKYIVTDKYDFKKVEGVASAWGDVRNVVGDLTEATGLSEAESGEESKVRMEFDIDEYEKILETYQPPEEKMNNIDITKSLSGLSKSLFQKGKGIYNSLIR